MEHIPGFELVPGRIQYPGAGQVRAGMQQRQDILELVAEPKGSAGLIQPGAAPQAAGQRLVEKPAVKH